MVSSFAVIAATSVSCVHFSASFAEYASIAFFIPSGALFLIACATFARDSVG